MLASIDDIYVYNIIQAAIRLLPALLKKKKINWNVKRSSTTKPVIWRLRPNRIGSSFALSTSRFEHNSRTPMKANYYLLFELSHVSWQHFNWVQSNRRILFWGWLRPNREWERSACVSVATIVLHKYFGRTHTARAATSRNSETMQMRNDIDFNALIRNHHNNNNNKSKRDDEDARQTNDKYNFIFIETGKSLCVLSVLCVVSSKIVSGGKCFQWDNGCAHDFYLFDTLASASSCLCYTTTHTH